MKKEIIAVLKDKEQITLQEIYAELKKCKASTRGVINSMVKRGELVRVSRATYKLPEKR